ncbi:hypothetical protein CHU98_g10743 [Xylaria longipes]|nr:hypothetical protein CHU98_g10743 [Xylaria longipes]
MQLEMTSELIIGPRNSPIIVLVVPDRELHELLMSGLGMPSWPTRFLIGYHYDALTAFVVAYAFSMELGGWLEQLTPTIMSNRTPSMMLSNNSSKWLVVV